MVRLALVLLADLLAASTACGSESHGPTDGPTDAPATDDGLSSCTGSAAPRAVLVALTADDAVDLYTLTPGSLTPSGVHLTGISKPGPIVMRDDGMEALAVYGGLGNPFGVAVITVTPDGSSAQVEQVLEIGSDSTAVSVAYSDHDHAMAALLSTQSEVVGLTRQGSSWVAGARVPAPATYPLQVTSLPNSTDLLLSRSQVGLDPTLDVYRMRASSGTWSAVGAPGSVTDQPFAMALHSSGTAFYVPSGDSANPVTSTNLEAPGILHAVTSAPTHSAMQAPSRSRTSAI